MGGICMNEFYKILERLKPLDVEKLKFLLADSFTGKLVFGQTKAAVRQSSIQYGGQMTMSQQMAPTYFLHSDGVLTGYQVKPDNQLAELESGEDVAIMFKKGNILEEKDDRKTFKESLQIIGRKDLISKLDIYLAIESHITYFEDYGYTFICHLGNEDRKVLKQSVASIPRDNEKEIEIHGGAGELGRKVFKEAGWKNKCESYFNRYFKTSRVIMVPSDGDAIMNTLSSVCSEDKGRGFVFKDYDIVKHLEFLGYDNMVLQEKLGMAPTSKSISYIAYIEKKHAVFICEKMSNVSNIHQCLKDIALKVKCFLTLYDREIHPSGVTVVGVLIRREEIEEDLVECKFCYLFSLSYKDFESPTIFENWWELVETYEDWWDFESQEMQSKLFDDLAAEIVCFMAVQKKGLPALTDDISKQFKQTYFLYTPQQMDIHFSDAKHVVIQGSYGSGKSLLGLKKLELISNGLRQNEKIVYINFDPKSKLHFSMEKNLKEFVQILPNKITRINGIRDILKSPNPSIYVYHNSAGEDLSSILQETVRLNTSTSEIAKTNYHIIVEEYDGETLTHDEAAKITKSVKKSVLRESNIILLAQPLMKSRSWNIGKTSYEKETCMFSELEDTFKIVKLEEVLRCSNEICGITKSTQNFVRDKHSVFTTEMGTVTLEQQQQPDDNKKRKPAVSPSLPESNYPNVETSTTEKIPDKSRDHGMVLDQAFKSSAALQNSKSAGSKIVSKFGFYCEPKQGVDIKGLKPNLVEFSEDIGLTSDVAVISLALVLKNFIGKNKATTLLHMADEQPRIVTRTIQFLLRLDENFSYTQDMEEYFQKNKKSKMIFSSNFCSVNGMEFDHVIIVVSQSEYYLKYYLPQAVSRCTYDLTFVLLPKEKENIKIGFFKKLFNFFSKTRNEKTEETVANMIEELKRECSVKQVVVTECKVCEDNCYCLKETGDKQVFGLHTHSKQYKDYLLHLASYTEFEEQGHSNSDRAGAKIQDFVKSFSQQQPSSASELGMDAEATKRVKEFDPQLVNNFIYAAINGDVSEVVRMLDEGMPVDIEDVNGITALQYAAMFNRTDVMHKLIERGANVNKQDRSGRTALHYSAVNNSTDAIQLLLEYGASTTIEDKWGRTPIDVAREVNHEEAVRLLQQ